MLPDGRQQQRFQFQHLRDLPPGEHPAHQHQNGKWISLQRFGGALVQRRQHILRLQRRQQDARIAADDPQQRVVIPALPVSGEGVEILPVLLIPQTEALPIALLRFRRHRLKAALGTLLHHVVEAIGSAVRQARDKGVLLRQRREDLPRVPIACDILRHFDGEFIGKPHDRQKRPLLFRQRIDHGGGKGGVDVGMAAGQHAALGERAQIQINGGEPPLAGIEKAFHLRVGKLRAAAVGIDGQLRVVKAQLLRADLIHFGPKPHRLRGEQKTIPACNDQMYICGQVVCQHTEEQRGALVGQQVKIVDENAAWDFARQRMAEIVHQQSAASGVCRTGIVPQNVKPGPGKRLLYAFPEDGEVVGVYADADDAQCLRLGALLQIPVHCRGLSVAHGGDHGGHGAAGDGPQALLQPLGYVNSIQVPFRFWHGSTLRCASTDFFAYNGFDLYVIIPVLAVSVNIIRIFLPFLAVKLQKERLYPAC